MKLKKNWKIVSPNIVFFFFFWGGGAVINPLQQQATWWIYDRTYVVRKGF